MHPKKNPVANPKTFERHCTCAKPHPAIEMEYYVGDDAAAVVAGDLKKEFPGGTILVLADDNTCRAAGDRVVAELHRHDVGHTLIKLPGDTVATDTVAESVRQQSLGHALILAVGSGTINDLAKHAAGKQKRPYWAFPTAPSMNGYTSSIAAVKVDGVKRTLACPPPRCIYVDPEVITMAPRKLKQAGYCDVMAKSVSDIDWQIESLLFSGSYCRLPGAIVAEAEAAYLDHPRRLGQGDKPTAMALLQGLLISGVAMSLAGSSAPASGGEHLVSHFLDMREAVTGQTPELHGLHVAAGIVVSAACYRRIAGIKTPRLRCCGEHAYQADENNISKIWGTLSREVQRRFSLKRGDLLKMDELLPKRWERIRKLAQSVRSPQLYLQQMRRTGHDLTLEALNLDEEEFLLAATPARAIRERITVLDIAAVTGVLQAAAEDALELLK